MSPRARLAAAIALLFSACHGDGAGTGSAGSGGAPDAGPVTLCQPGATRACYSGATDLIGFGACRAGVETCADDGSGYGPCEGEVLPSGPDCAGTTDDDCDGAPGCHGQTLWARVIAAPTLNHVSDIAVDPAGNVIAAFASSGVLRLDGAAIASTDGLAVMVLKLDPAGEPAWVRRLDTSWPQGNVRSAVDGAGNVIAAWEQLDTFDLGGMPVTWAAAHVAKLDPDGNLLWSQVLDAYAPFGTPEVAVAADGSGRIAILASGTGSFTIGGPALFPVPGMPQEPDRSAVALLDPGGDRIWAHTFDQPLSDVGVRTRGGGALITGHSTGFMSIDLGGGPISGVSGLVARFDAAGDHVWSDGSSDMGFGGLLPLSFGPGAGSSDARAFFMSDADIPKDTPGCDPQVAGAALLVRDPAGAITGARCLPTTGIDDLGSDGTLVYLIAGAAGDFGGGVPPKGRFARVLAAFDETATVRWARRLYRGDEPSISPGPRVLAVDPQGGIAYIGPLIDGADFGDGPVPAVAGLAQLVVMRMSP